MKNKKKIVGSIIILLIFVILIFIGALSYHSKEADDFKVDDSFTEDQSKKSEKIGATAVNKEIKAQIYGQVKNPGVYSLNNNDRILDLVKKAGGFTEKADMYSINGAAKVVDGSNVYIMAKGEKSQNINNTAAGSAALGEVNSNEKLDINSATEQDIVNKKIRGIGEGFAKRIIDYREKNGGRINSVDDLKKAIGNKRGEAIMEYIEIR